MRTVSPLSDEAVTRILFELGPRVLVLVEGATDEEVFTLWYAERRDKLRFLAAGGWDTVEKLLQRIVDAGATRAFAIIDRDFRPDSAVEAPFADTAARLFILRRYELENYLLEPAAIAEELLINKGAANAPSVIDVQNRLQELCEKLGILAAADQLLSDEGLPLLEIGFNRLHEGDVLDSVGTRMSLDRKSMHVRLQRKRDEIRPHLGSLETAHAFIRGKRLLHFVWKMFTLKVYTDHLIRLLARAVKMKCGIHADISRIIEKRILR